jgi:hypothetical protein
LKGLRRPLVSRQHLYRDDDARFAFGLNLLLDAIESRIGD